MTDTRVGETFEDQFAAEMADLGLRPPEKKAFSEPQKDHERWVVDNPNDVVGLALSGGGIRSAIFNLGFLQGLADLDLLGYFHYLATVSGGGYVGGWWSTYRSRRIAAARAAGSEEPAGSFPKPRFDGQEAPEVHHLREFSRFLAPRWGFFELEMWQFFSALFTAMAPALVIAASLLFVVASTWLLLLFYAFTSARLSLDAATGIITLTVLVLAEIGTAKKESVRNGFSANPVGYSIVTSLTVGFIFLVNGLLPVIGAASMAESAFVEQFAQDRTTVDPVLFHPATVWLTLAAILIFLRFVFSRAFQPAGSWFLRAPLDRVIARLFALAVAWVAGILVFGVVWYLQSDALKAAAVGLVGSGSAGAFAWFRKLTAREPARAKTGGLLENFRVFTPRVLAAVAFAAAVVGSAFLVLETLQLGIFRETYVAASGIVLLSLFVFAPNEVGLHAFYKARIARAFLGASNFLREPWPAPAGGRREKVPSPNQESSEQKGDDVLITDLPRSGPFHLICCAANDLAGNPLTNLDRGARSAVISRLGFSVADSFHRWSAPGQKVISLGAALTASAAAFNSNMGSKSVDYGFGAAFVMSALNLRLGLWLVPPQKSLFDRILVGALFIEEMFGRTVADFRKGPVHLSDGGHFDNTALYELLRRHCRYILVSDCGEDPDVQFDDLGNALRRAREDFSVEIDVNLDVLRPDADGFCAQHVAVGDIHYPNGDRGIIVVVKPGLAGEEPRDVLQYRGRNARFPHESTGDQFYDEKQWESYRRLGLHAARTVFRFVQHYGDRRSLTRYELFGQLRQEWYPTPPGLAEATLQRSSTAEDIERQLAAIGCLEIAREIYPELPGEPQALGAEETARFLPVLAQMLQFMEDVYFTCQLEHHWNHPLNLGWTNYFARWATMPVFRNWWPLLSPMFGPKFVRFMEELFVLPSVNGRNTGLPLAAAVSRGFDPNGVAAVLWKQSGADFPDPAAAATYTYRVTLTDGSTVDVGLVFVELHGDIACWAKEDLYVPASFWGAGFEEDFLSRLLSVLPQLPAKVAWVTLREPLLKDEASQQRYADVLQTYRAQGFEISGRTNGACVLQRAL